MGGEGAFLSNLHFVALANLLKRPVILIASRQNVRQWGAGYHGIAGAFLPLRHLEEIDPDGESSSTTTQAGEAVRKMLGAQRPVVLSWGSEARDHFVPLVPLVEKWNPNGFVEAPVGFPVPVPTALEEGGAADPFCSGPGPTRWTDALCRSAGPGVYSGCWEAKFWSGGDSEDLLKLQFPPLYPAPDGRAPSQEAALDALLLLQHCETEGDSYREALTILGQMLGNLIKVTDITAEQRIKYRRIKIGGKTFQKRVGSKVGGQEMFMAVGFQHVNTVVAAAAAAAKQKEKEKKAKENKEDKVTEAAAAAVAPASASMDESGKGGAAKSDESIDDIELVLHPGRENSDVITRVFKNIDSVLNSFMKQEAS